jgi:hypothetical protein
MRRRMESGAFEAAERIAAASPSDDDDLGRVATSLRSGGSWLAAVSDPDPLFAKLASVVTLDADPERLAVDVEGAIPDIHNRLWDPIVI